VCAGLAGEVVEIGFGSGHNVPFYPTAVERVAAVEPADLGWKLAAGRVAASAVPIERAGLDGQKLPFDEDSFDSAVSTWTMCTIPDLDAALAEARRVLRPGGSLRFVEHAVAPGRSMARIQRAIQPVWGPAAGGCHVDRDVLGRLRAAGFAVTTTYEGYLGVVSPASWFVMGSAPAA
jgi:ubiquinone/menaquinone biosynthesis C-methylase UbiE